MEDISYEALPYAPVMLTATIVVVSASLLTLVYLTVRSYRSLVELQLEDNLSEHKMLADGNQYKDTVSPDKYFSTKYFSFQSDNQNNVVQAECSCHLGTDLINEDSTMSFDMQNIDTEENVIYELESTLTNTHSFGMLHYGPQYNEVSNLVCQVLADPSITNDSHRQDSYCAHDEVISSCCTQDEHLVDPTNIRLNINMFENPLDLTGDLY